MSAGRRVGKSASGCGQMPDFVGAGGVGGVSAVRSVALFNIMSVIFPGRQPCALCLGRPAEITFIMLNSFEQTKSSKTSFLSVYLRINS